MAQVEQSFLSRKLKGFYAGSDGKNKTFILNDLNEKVTDDQLVLIIDAFSALLGTKVQHVNIITTTTGGIVPED